MSEELSLENFQEYFVLDDTTGNLYVRSDLKEHIKELKGDRIWQLLKIMFFNSKDPDEIIQHEGDIKAFEEGEKTDYYKLRQEFNGKRDVLLDALIERDGYYCRQCYSTESLTVDHIHPVIKGGQNLMSNLQILCRSCNSRKGAR